MKTDRVIGAITVGAALVLAVTTATIDILASQPTLSARFFPYVLAGVLCAGGLALFIRPADAPIADALAKLVARRGLVFAALFLVYALTFRFVDYRLGTWAFVLVAMWALGSRSRVELLVLPLAVSTSIWLLFRHAFTVLLPVWI